MGQALRNDCYLQPQVQQNTKDIHQLQIEKAASDVQFKTLCEKLDTYITHRGNLIKQLPYVLLVILILFFISFSLGVVIDEKVFTPVRDKIIG